MAHVAIVTDSNSGITQAAGKELGVRVLPMPFYINEELFFEDIRALPGGALVHVLLRQHAQVRGGDQLPPGLPLQLQRPPGKDIHIPEPDPLKKGGLVDPDKVDQRQVELLAEALPAGIRHGGQGDKTAGQVQLPVPVGGDKIVIDHRLRGFRAPWTWS